MTSPFARSAPLLRANSYSVVPLRPREKRPCGREWQRYCHEHAGDHLFRQWMRIADANVGVCLGPASGLVALDFDDDADGLHSKVVDIAGESPVKKAGHRGHTAFYRFGGERSRGYGVGKRRVLDVLACGRQTVLPPSVHPEGMDYRWLTERTLENTSLGELPALAADGVERIDALFGRAARPPAAARSWSEDGSCARMAEALRFIPADDYDTWVRVGMALKAAYGEPGYALWDEWSASDDKYDPREMRYKWDSFRGQGVTAGTLLYHARRHGYGGPPDQGPSRR